MIGRWCLFFSRTDSRFELNMDHWTSSGLSAEIQRQANKKITENQLKKTQGSQKPGRQMFMKAFLFVQAGFFFSFYSSSRQSEYLSALSALLENSPLRICLGQWMEPIKRSWMIVLVTAHKVVSVTLLCSLQALRRLIKCLGNCIMAISKRGLWWEMLGQYWLFTHLERERSPRLLHVLCFSVHVCGRRWPAHHSLCCVCKNATGVHWQSGTWANNTPLTPRARAGMKEVEGKRRWGWIPKNRGSWSAVLTVRRHWNSGLANWFAYLASRQAKTRRSTAENEFFTYFVKAQHSLFRVRWCENVAQDWLTSSGIALGPIRIIVASGKVTFYQKVAKSSVKKLVPCCGGGMRKMWVRVTAKQ